MTAFELQDQSKQPQASEQPYLEFLRVPALSRRLDVHPAECADSQQLQREDEVYFVVSGRARIQVGNEDCPVEAGSTVYVPEEVEHHLHSVAEDLNVLVFFTPAETTVSERY